MKLSVRFTRRASIELHRIADWYSEQLSHLGEQWLRGIQQTIATLQENPQRCGLSHENQHFSYELREIYYGVGRRKTHRVLFRVTEQEVIVLGIRHFSQQDIGPNDI